MAPGVSLGSLVEGRTAHGARGLSRRSIQGCRNGPQASSCPGQMSQRALRYDLRVPPEHERRGCPSTPPVPLPQQQACCPAHPCGRCLCASTRVPTGSLLFSYTAWVAASSVCPWSLRLHRDVTCAPSPTPQVASVRGSYKRHLNTPLWVTVTANPAR